MIIKIFDQGWGKEFPIKQLELEITNSMLRHIMAGMNKTVVINSLWYTDELHETVINYLQNNYFTHIVLISMIDPFIAHPGKFAFVDRPISCIGNYKGEYEIDFWALVVDRFMPTYPLEQLLNVDHMCQSFMCLNRKPHAHRITLFAQLKQHCLLDKGTVSMGDLKLLDHDVNPLDLAPNAGLGHHGIPNDVASLGLFDYWQKHFLNVVTETVFDIQKHNFVSEKIYKPIVGCRPFLVYAKDGATAWLDAQGFQSYVDDFKDITDIDLNDPDHIADFLCILSAQPDSYLRHKFLALKEKILYNKTQFEKHVKKQKQTITRGVSCLI